MRNLVLLILCGILTGCGAARPTQSDYTVVYNVPDVTPDSASGVVYFMRESAFTGGAVSYFIDEDGSRIGLLRSGSYFIHKTAPGQHTYSAETEKKSFVTISVEPEKTHYIVGTVGMGFWIGVPVLTEVTEPVAKNLLSEGLQYTRLKNAAELTEAMWENEAKK